MSMDDRDWLDQKLASETYVTDNGFTARVLERLPAGQMRSLNVRRVILTMATVLAAGLMLVQSISLARSLQQLGPGPLIANLFNAVGAHAQSLPFLAGVATGLSLLTLTVIFLSRRWT